MYQPYVIILANGLNGLEAVRSAAQAGLKTYTLLTDNTDLCGYSRFSQHRFVLPTNPTVDDLRPVLDQLNANENGPGVLFACSDLAAELLGQLKNDGYTNQHLIVPSTETTDILNDKKLECEYMESGGITLPKTLYCLGDEAPRSYPLIIKPRTFRDYKLLGAKNVIVNSEPDFEKFRDRFDHQLDRFIAQEVIPGSDDNLWVCNVTFDQDHSLSACFVFKRLGTMPSHFGVTSLAISEDNQKLRKECAKIGKALRYTGPAMIEFKKDQGSDTYYYIETNPRLGMCNWFDTRCGVNNILACTKVAYGQHFHQCSQRNKVVYWNFFGDLIARLEDRENPVSIFLRYLLLLPKSRVGAIFYWKDPKPAFRYTSAALRDLTQRVARKLREILR
jgi:predicted ATP-grasp superfamily ATP-dependent carboligase